MPTQISPDQMAKNEQQVLDFIKKMWGQTQEKKIWARLITAVIIIIAIYQELGTDIHLTDTWKEITIIVIAGYFGVATYRTTFRYIFQAKGEENE
ncbi:hypothetical protein JW960_09795 [candidate division KSB1 bacterium]|nr:hypothetical protein [candidate division KSB1 bacterium]